MLVALGACGDGFLETVTTIEGVCTEDLRLAVLVTLDNPDDLPIDEVTATRLDEQHCYLESRRGFTSDDAGEREGALYSCWEQGRGAYLVRVQSGKRAWTQTVDVPGDECHVTKVQKVTMTLD